MCNLSAVVVHDEASATLSRVSKGRRVMLQAPFVWFGGKSRAATLIWDRLGDVDNYVEPFFGSGAVLLGRPRVTGTETVNDLDGYLANFWRATQHDPDAVAMWADNPVNENDLHARHVWLLQRSETLQASLEGDPEYFDARVAGWWVWGMACWIGSGFCSGKGPWWVNESKQLVRRDADSIGVNRKRVHLSNAGKGVKRGVDLRAWFTALRDRLRDVRVCSGDWSRVCGDSVTIRHSVTGIVLDPPYADTAGRDSDIYRIDSTSVAHDVREWALAHGDHPLLRIALCGYDGEHQMPDSWACVPWKAAGGYGAHGNGRGRDNAARERIWFSPACDTSPLFRHMDRIETSA